MNPGSTCYATAVIIIPKISATTTNCQQARKGKKRKTKDINKTQKCTSSGRKRESLVQLPTYIRLFPAFLIFVPLPLFLCSSLPPRFLCPFLSTGTPPLFTSTIVARFDTPRTVVAVFFFFFFPHLLAIPDNIPRRSAVFFHSLFIWLLPRFRTTLLPLGYWTRQDLSSSFARLIETAREWTRRTAGGGLGGPSRQGAKILTTPTLPPPSSDSSSTSVYSLILVARAALVLPRHTTFPYLFVPCISDRQPCENHRYLLFGEYPRHYCCCCR